jgi:hypothetical protein
VKGFAWHPNPATTIAALSRNSSSQLIPPFNSTSSRTVVPHHVCWRGGQSPAHAGNHPYSPRVDAAIVPRRAPPATDQHDSTCKSTRSNSPDAHACLSEYSQHTAPSHTPELNAIIAAYVHSYGRQYPLMESSRFIASRSAEGALARAQTSDDNDRHGRRTRPFTASDTSDPHHARPQHTMRPDHCARAPPPRQLCSRQRPAHTSDPLHLQSRAQAAKGRSASGIVTRRPNERDAYVRTRPPRHSVISTA